MNSNTTHGLTAYREQDVVASVQAMLEQGNLALPLTAESISFDQYHSGGREAVDRVLDDLNLTASDRLLDVGSGFGGPARIISARSGATVVGVDITTQYVEAAKWLTEQTQQSHRVTFVCSEIGELPREPHFDAALTMHVQMNIEGKSSWYRSIGEHVRPGGRLAIWEICKTSDAELTWPMPWSITGDDSYLATQDDLRSAIEQAGFTTIAWVDDSAWLTQWFSAQVAAGPGNNRGLGLLDNGLQRTMNFAMAFTTGQLTVARAVFTRE